jgi:hypothetical protein
MKTSILLLTLGLLSWVGTAQAHKPSDSYLALRDASRGASGYWDLALRDLDRALTLDADGDGALTWGELRGREQELRSYAFARLSLARAGQPCPVEAGALTLVEHSDGRYVRLPFSSRCQAEAGALSLDYRFFFELDPQHRSIVRVGSAAAGEQTFVLSKAQHTLALGLTAAPAEGSWALVKEGVGHILSGLDHVLFLLALLLPSVLRKRDAQATPSMQMGRVMREVVQVVTAFTVAHSLTLGLAALGLVSMSASIIEPAIAASVAIAALDNLWPVFGSDRWSIAFVLGLLHGFGFSSALADLGLQGADLLRGLFAFNAGVELGQLFIVLAFVPLAFLLRERWSYRFVVFRGGSLAIAGLSLVWFVERVRGG